MTFPSGVRRMQSASIAASIPTDVSYFGTMMVHLNLADGMVSGSVAAPGPVAESA